jgi:biopolymer transport protein ExbD
MSFPEPFSSAGTRDGAAATFVPLICGAVALSVFFLFVMASGIVPRGARGAREIPLELAAVAEGAVPPRFSAREVIVHVGPGGEIRAGGASLTVEELLRRLSGLAEGAAETSVTVRAAAAAPYGVVARVLGAIRRAGVRDAALLTIEPSEGPSGSPSAP